MFKELVLNVDDAGLHPDIISGIELLWEQRSISTTSVLSTSPILDTTVERLKQIGIPVGVHLILDGDRPVLDPAKIPSIVNEQGKMLSDASEIRKRLVPREAFNELSAQIENVKKRGLKISHLDSHRGLCFLIPAMRAVYRELGLTYTLPLALPAVFIFGKTRRLVPGSSDSLVGVYAIGKETIENRLVRYERIIKLLARGKHYCFSHAAPPTQSVKTELDDFAIRNNDYDLFLSPEWKKLLEKYQVRLSPM